jgi:uncharacterized membrane protein YecN with MAPEG domain
MMMNLLTGVALWMVAAVALGLLFGGAMHGYGVARQPVPVPLAEAEGQSAFQWAA